MDNENTEVKQEEKTEPKRSGDYINKVILVQAVVCAFVILLIVIASKMSPQTFEFIKDEYNDIMSVNMNAADVVESVKGAAENVMSPDIATGEEEETTKKEETTTKQADGEGGEDSEIEDTAVAVMASMGKNKGITVPVNGNITSRYGYRTNPISGAYGLHTGLDIAADEGTNIVAAYNGVVKDTGVGEKKGNYVLMLHADGSETLYCHCSEVLVEEGTVIRAGEIIARVGSTGWSTGPHLHFEIHINGCTVDPLTVIKENKGSV